MIKKFLLLLLLCVTSTLHAANYLTFTAEADSSSFGIHNVGGNDPDVQYSLDNGETWTKLTNDTLIRLVRKGDKALLKGLNPKGFSPNELDLLGETPLTSFVMTGRIAASGSVMSLIDGKGETTVIPNDYCFYKLFSRCESLTQAPQLPATRLANWCYGRMFRGCTSLTQAPQLPATRLANWCYKGMFSYCTRLTQAPQLPATRLAERCYEEMFSDCISLKQAPKLPAKKLESYCYNKMFRWCIHLTEAPELPATQMAWYCYAGMFRGCTRLTKAPDLPAQKLARGCYRNMFKRCSHLSEIKVGFTDWGQTYSLSSRRIWKTQNWLLNVASNGKFICPKGLPKEFGEDGIPEGWKVIEN